MFVVGVGLVGYSAYELVNTVQQLSKLIQ